MDERQTGGFRHGAKVLVVGHHDGDLRTQAACAPAEDEVVEAVAELRNHHQQALGAAVVDGELHVELIGDGGELGAEAFRGNFLVSRSEGRAQVELAADVVIELLVFNDVEAAISEE